MPPEQAERDTPEHREPETFDPAARLYQSEWAFYRKPARLAAGFLCVVGLIYGERFVSSYISTIVHRWLMSTQTFMTWRLALIWIIHFLFSMTVWGIVWLTWWSVRREHRLGRADDLTLSLLDSRELWRAKYWPLARTLWLVLPLTLLGSGFVEQIVMEYRFENKNLPAFFIAESHWLSINVPSILLKSLVPCFGLPLVVYYLMLRWPRLAREGLFVALAALLITVSQWIISLLGTWLFNSRLFTPLKYAAGFTHYFWAWQLVYSTGLSALIIWPLARRAVPRFRELFNTEL